MKVYAVTVDATQDGSYEFYTAFPDKVAFIDNRDDTATIVMLSPEADDGFSEEQLTEKGTQFFTWFVVTPDTVGTHWDTSYSLDIGNGTVVLNNGDLATFVPVIVEPVEDE